MRRFSSGSTWVTFSRWSDHVLPTSVHTGAKLSASVLRPASSSAVPSRRRVMPNAAISAVPKLSFASSVEQRLLLRVGGREAGFDQVDAEVVERVRDADLLVDRERHPLALHAVAQGRVIDDDLHAWDGTGTRSSQSA